ncbi:hypothetical protein AXG93_3491s1040 [Marchantia polymorpha subsp. ruderalis]|uniref:Uncharacterized protein n=1 Tax=Marchantia polymorpha subsp. ruderalis TaxID=1480154 RepID=A0A176VQM2_MARPO|nr:hypothetical protein AXG93_3491s1040 [Marchantia polymorpha subsp. ruderalis]
MHIELNIQQNFVKNLRGFYKRVGGRQQARRLVLRAERASIMRHSRGVSQLKPETVKKIQDNIGNLYMIFYFDGTLVAAGAGLGEKDG